MPGVVVLYNPDKGLSSKPASCLIVVNTVYFAVFLVEYKRKNLWFRSYFALKALVSWPSMFVS